MLKKIFYTTISMALISYCAPISAMERFPTVLINKIFEQAILPNHPSERVDLQTYHNINQVCKKWHGILVSDFNRDNPLIHKQMFQHFFEHLLFNFSLHGYKIEKPSSQEEFLSFIKYFQNKESLVNIMREFKSDELTNLLYYFSKKSTIKLEYKIEDSKKLFISFIEDSKKSYAFHFFKNNTQGPCLIIFANGEIYLGKSRDFKANGQGIYIYRNGSIAKGYFVNDGELNGEGKYIWADNSTYKGGFVNGKKQGFGIIFFKNSDTYEGKFDNDQQNGKGTYTWEDGRIYKGSFVNGKKHGKGTMYFNNGDKYKGNFDNDQQNGEGTYTWEDGRIYKGSFVNGKKHGKGTMTLKPIEVEHMNDEMLIPTSLNSTTNQGEPKTTRSLSPNNQRKESPKKLKHNTTEESNEESSGESSDLLKIMNNHSGNGF